MFLQYQPYSSSICFAHVFVCFLFLFFSSCRDVIVAGRTLLLDCKHITQSRSKTGEVKKAQTFIILNYSLGGALTDRSEDYNLLDVELALIDTALSGRRSHDTTGRALCQTR